MWRTGLVSSRLSQILDLLETKHQQTQSTTRNEAFNLRFSSILTQFIGDHEQWRDSTSYPCPPITISKYVSCTLCYATATVPRRVLT